MSAPIFTALVAAALTANGGARPVLVVDPGRDQSLPCPANAALGDALRLMLPDVPVLEPAAPPGPNPVDAALAFEEGAWRFSLSTADGSTALARRLEGSAQDCVAVANAAAVITDRYFTEVVWPGQTVQVQPLPPPPPLIRSLSIGGGLSYRAPIGISHGPVVEAALAARIGERGFAQVGASLGAPQSVPVVIDGRDRGALSAAYYSGWLGGGACAGNPAATSFCGGAFASAFVMHGLATGNLFQTRDQVLVAPEVGLFGMFTQPVWRALEVGVTLRAGALLVRPGIAVEGSDAALHAPPVDLVGGLRFGGSFF